MTRSTQRLVVLLAIAAAGAGCTAGRAQIPEQQPTLVVPPVPPRSIDLPPVAELPAAPAPADPPPAAAPNTKPRQRAQAEVKPDPKQDTPIEPVAPPPNPPAVAPLRTSTSPTGPEATRQIREILDNTQKMLDKVDALQSDDRKANFTQAKAFIQQAEEALKKDELTQARTFADRALNIAKLLASGR